MKQLDPERVAELAETASRLGALKDAPGWADLTAIVDREQERYFAAQVKKLRNGEDIDQDENRVWVRVYDLVNYLLKHPEKAETTLRRAIEKAERLGVLQEEVPT